MAVHADQLVLMSEMLPATMLNQQIFMKACSLFLSPWRALSFLFFTGKKREKKRKKPPTNSGSPSISISLLRIIMTCRNSNNDAIADVLSYIRSWNQRHFVWNICMLLCIYAKHIWCPQTRMWCENCCGNKTKTLCNLAAMKTTINYSLNKKNYSWCLSIESNKNISNFGESVDFEKAVVSI